MAGVSPRVPPYLTNRFTHSPYHQSPKKRPQGYGNSHSDEVVSSVERCSMARPTLPAGRFGFDSGRFVGWPARVWRACHYYVRRNATNVADPKDIEDRRHHARSFGPRETADVADGQHDHRNRNS